jgi:hypothetical protein
MCIENRPDPFGQTVSERTEAAAQQEILAHPNHRHRICPAGSSAAAVGRE